MLLKWFRTIEGLNLPRKMQENDEILERRWKVPLLRERNGEGVTGKEEESLKIVL